MDVYKPLVGERVIKALKSKETPDSVLIRAGRENLKRYMLYLDWLAAHRSYLAGRNMSMADLGIAAHISVMDYLGEIEWDDYPDAKMWYMKIKSRPSFAPLLSDKVSGIMPAEKYAELDF